MFDAIKCASLSVLLSGAIASQFAHAQPTSAAGAGVSSPSLPGYAPAGVDRDLSEWLQRTHEASKRRKYQGTFVVSSAYGMSTAKIWHACDGQQQMERVDALTGPPRTTIRHNQNVITFMPESRVAKTEQRDSLGMFPNMQPQSFATIADYYTAKSLGPERVAGVDTEILHLSPRDNLRYGYRVWSERKSGLVVKVQTLDESARVIEQAAFSELQLDAPVRMESLSAAMRNTQGYKIERDELLKTTAAAEGWSLRSPIPGFLPNGCHKRPADGVTNNAASMQWVFTDGLASVSLFVEQFDAKRHTVEGNMNMGATNTLSRKLDGQNWLTAMGEVPLATLRAFASALQRK